jgi:hypothetical protein
MQNIKNFALVPLIFFPKILKNMGGSYVGKEGLSSPQFVVLSALDKPALPENSINRPLPVFRYSKNLHNFNRSTASASSSTSASTSASVSSSASDSAYSSASVSASASAFSSASASASSRVSLALLLASLLAEALEEEIV